MSSLFKNSVIDSISLDKEKFENFIALGKSIQQVREMFCLPLLSWNGEDISNLDIPAYFKSPENVAHISSLLEKWCRENYNIPFNSVYHLVQSSAVSEFEDVMVELGIRGNPSAIAIANEVIRKEKANSVVSINFINSLPTESEEDKLDD